MRHLLILAALQLASTQLHAQSAVANIRQIYGMNDTNMTGAGRTVAIIINGWFDQQAVRQDLQTYSQLAGLPPAKMKYVTVGAAPDGNAPDWSTESRIDVQMVHTMAPRAKIIVFIDNGGPNGPLNALRAAVKANVDVVSMSFGQPESHYSNIDQWEAVFTAHPEITFIAGSGDSGSNGGQVAYPASSPEVLAVGGVNEDMSANPAAWSGSGGGRSGYFPTPDYQANVTVDTGGSRVIPDIAMNAVGANCQIYSSSAGGFVRVSGTSVAAPLAAGMIATVDQAFGYALGDLHSTIYSAMDSGLQANYFRDVVAGSNGGFNALPGFDMVTGAGVPNVETMINLFSGN